MRFSYYAQKIGLWVAVFGLTGLLFFLFVNPRFLGIQNNILKLLILAMISIISYYAYRRMNDFRLNKGLDGEYEVLKVLRTLPKEYLRIRDFHSEKLGNIDFIVVGPTGVWTIEVKNYKTKKITVENDELFGDGFSVDELRKQAYSGAKILHDYLNSRNIFCPVNPILVLTNPETDIRLGLSRIKGVNVIGIKWLTKVLTEHEKSLTVEKCKQISYEIKKRTSII